MPDKRIKQLILDLSFEQKMLGVGLIFMLISLFLPWYQDLDLFKTGDMFLGLTGPMYFGGYTIMLICLLDLALLVSGALNVKIPFNVKPSSVYLASGIVFFYLLLLTNSVYFHQKFGVNILNKESPFGMFIAFISASLITIGGYISTRDKKALLREFQEQTQEPLIKLNEQIGERKPKEVFRSLNPRPAAATVTPTAPAPTTRITAGMNMVQKAAIDTIKSHESNEAFSKKQPQPYRMDL